MDRKNWVDGHSTTVEWEALARPLAVLPIGSFEQHGSHLPVALDTIQAEYFAHVTAQALGGALLPALPLFQCYEHSGFRGSVGLKPETAMALIRDIADSLERQHFKRLVIINGHGGNQALGPVVRDLNRQNRSLKLLLLDWYAFDTSPEGVALQKKSVHASGWETSVALALWPDLVRDFSSLAPESASWHVSQSDLNHFGMGVLHPPGYWGDPRDASAEAGRAIVKSVEANLVAAVRDRLDYLDAQPDYAGVGRVLIRPLERWDLPDCMGLVRAAGWNQRLEDWRLVYALSPEGLFVATHNGAVVGSVGTVNYADLVSWIAMVLVDPTMRRRGIATQLMRTCLDKLATCETVKLDATPAGREVYRKLGFVDECQLSRLTVSSVPAISPQKTRIRPMTEADLPHVAELDAQAFGVPRGDLLGRIRVMAPEYAFVSEGTQGLDGFCVGRHGATCEYLGPLTARDDSTARALAASVLGVLRGRSAMIDVPVTQPDWQAWLKSLGFSEQRIFLRMAKGPNRFPGRRDFVFGIAGPEFG